MFTFFHLLLCLSSFSSTSCSPSALISTHLVQFVQPNTLWNGADPGTLTYQGLHSLPTFLLPQVSNVNSVSAVLEVHAHLPLPVLECCLAWAWTCFMLQAVTNTGNSYCSNVLLSGLCLENILLAVICYLWLVLQSFCPFFYKEVWVFEGENVIWCPEHLANSYSPAHWPVVCLC